MSARLATQARNVDPRGETLARDAFQKILRKAGIRDARWRRGREPPDYYLRVANASYAVEVTRVMDTHEVGGVAMPTRTVRASLEKLSTTVKQEAAKAGLLSGTYTMALAPIPQLRQVGPQLVKDALQYIEATRSLGMAPRFVLAAAPHGRSITIQKFAAAPDQVGAIILVGTPRRAHRVEQDLVRLIGDRVRRKRTLLSHLRLPRILLLVDSYVFGELEHWRHAAAQVDLAEFHTVARIADVGICQVLHSNNKVWCSSASEGEPTV